MFTPGQAVEWLWESRAGWGYRRWVPAVVVKVGRTRVTIDAQLARGGTKRVAVKADRLRTLPTPAEVLAAWDRPGLGGELPF